LASRIRKTVKRRKLSSSPRCLVRRYILEYLEM
jgi:hypothetical protein